jgi:hypothetical protein
MGSLSHEAERIVMHAFWLQKWTTIRGGVTVVNQPEHEYLDLEPFQDAFFWLEVSNITGTPTLAYQTSPTLDDILFTTMTASPVSLAVTGPNAPVVTSVFMLSGTVPLARYVRWQLSGTPTWDATFRVAVAANAPGL